jgi:spore coat protein SA
MMNQEKIRILIISGTLETSLHPVPPVADGAPEWNVFRLTEAAAHNLENDLEIHVISPCERDQVESLQNFPIRAKGNYHNIVFHPFLLRLYRNVLRYISPLRLFVRRAAKLPDLMSWWYLIRVNPLLKNLSPHMVLINGRPQYVRYLRPRVPAGRLWLFMRAEMGESRKYLGLLDGIIVNSDGMAKYACELIKPGFPPVYKMPNTLGTEFSIPLASNERFKSNLVIFAGRLIPDKGVMELLNAFEIVLKEIPTARLFIYGASGNYKDPHFSTAYEQSLLAKAASMPAGSVKFAGYVPNIELGSHYIQANVAVFPSLCKESFGMVALEAMRCGTPVVASRQPGFEELISPGGNGLLVDDPQNIESLANAIVHILEDPYLAQSMGQESYQRSLRYTPEHALQALLQILQQNLVTEPL